MHIYIRKEFLSWYDEHTDNPIPFFDLDNLPAEIPTVGDIYKTTVDGVVVKKLENEKTKYESLSSAHSGMAFKFFHNGMNCDPYVELKCSPAKLLQGHNLYGFDDMELSCNNMIALLSVAYPVFFGFLDLYTVEISEIDINYSTFIQDPYAKKAFLDHLKYVSNGHTKHRDANYATTCYFGKKNSRYKSLKCYSKFEEMENDALKMDKQGFPESAIIIRREALTDRAKGAVRFEATIKKRFLQMRGIPTDLIGLCRYLRNRPDTYRLLFNEAWEPIFKALRGHTMKRTNDNDIYDAIYTAHSTVQKNGSIGTVKVNRLFAFYQTVKIMGFEHVKSVSTSSTMSRNLNDLIVCGLSKSFIQNLHKESGCVVIQMSKYIEIDFSNQVPKDYVLPSDLDFSCVA